MTIRAIGSIDPKATEACRRTFELAVKPKVYGVACLGQTRLSRRRSTQVAATGDGVTNNMSTDHDRAFKYAPEADSFRCEALGASGRLGHPTDVARACEIP